VKKVVLVTNGLTKQGAENSEATQKRIKIKDMLGMFEAKRNEKKV
jgi:hypothetical protein